MEPNQAKNMVDFLNELLEMDPTWVSAMVNFRPACNGQILNHPSVICVSPEENDGVAAAGLIGLLNGFFGLITTHKGLLGKIGFIIDNKTRQIEKFVYTGPK